MKGDVLTLETASSCSWRRAEEAGSAKFFGVWMSKASNFCYDTFAKQPWQQKTAFFFLLSAPHLITGITMGYSPSCRNKGDPVSPVGLEGTSGSS